MFTFIISGICACLTYLVFCIVFALFGNRLSNSIKYRLLLIPVVLAVIPPLNLGIKLSLPQTQKSEIHIQNTAVTITDNHTEQTVPAVVYTPDDAKAPSKTSGYINNILLYSWLAGICILILARASGELMTRRTLAKISCAPDDNTQRIFNELNTWPHAQLRCYAGAGTPFVYGIFRPKIYLPQHGISSEELPLALAHELVHIRRGDLAVKLAAEAICILHFYNPVIYLLRGSIEKMCELSCDESATRNLNKIERKRYSMLLLSLMKQSKAPRSCASLCSNDRNIRKRINTIMYEKKHSRMWVIAAILMTACAVGISGCAFALTHSTEAKETVQGGGLRGKLETYMEQEMYRVFSPHYEILSLDMYNYEENEQEQSATFYYTLTHKNYDRDPDTVPYIAELREKGNPNYEQLKREYLAPQEANFELKAVVDGDEITLYTNTNPHGITWEKCTLDDFILSGKTVISGGEKIDYSDPERTVKEFFESFAVRDYEGMKAFCTDKFINSAFANVDNNNKDFSAVLLINSAVLKKTDIPFTEYLKSSNDFNITVDIEVVPAVISSDSRTQRTYEMQLLRQNSGAYLIDGMKLISAKDM